MLLVSCIYNTPQIQKRGKLLKIEPKVPPVQNKRLATCNDIKETHVHIPSGIKYFTHTVLHYCRPYLTYCTEHDTKQHPEKHWSLDLRRGAVCNIFTPSSSSFSFSYTLFFIYDPSESSSFFLRLIHNPVSASSLCSVIVFRGFCVLCFSFHFCTHSPSVFLHAALCPAPPSQGFVTFFLQVTGKIKRRSCVRKRCEVWTDVTAWLRFQSDL